MAKNIEVSEGHILEIKDILFDITTMNFPSHHVSSEGILYEYTNVINVLNETKKRCLELQEKCGKIAEIIEEYD